MDKVIVLLSLLLISSCVVRDNPLDIHGDSYEKPSFTINGIPENRVVLNNNIVISCSGNSNANLYRYQLDGGNWSDWQGGEWSHSVQDGFHTLHVQAIYPDGVDTSSSPEILFSSLSTSESFYFSPPDIKVSNPNVTFSSYGFSDSIATIHFELTVGTIKDVRLMDTTFTKVLFADSVMDISVLPGGKLISGTRNIAKLTLANVLPQDTVGFTVLCKDKNGSTVAVSGILGTVVE